MVAASEITYLTGESSSTETPAPQSIAAGKAPAYAGPSLADLAGVFSTPPASASTRPSSSSRAPVGRSRSRSVPPPLGTRFFQGTRRISQIWAAVRVCSILVPSDECVVSGERPAGVRAKMHVVLGFLLEVLHAQCRFPSLGSDFLPL
jgi:hypothetical protein